MPKQPLFPHVPGRKAPLFPHASGRKQQVNKESYYWTAMNKDTGEIAEYSTPYATPDLALQAGENFASETWGKDTALIEVWTQPHRYSEKLAIQAVVSKTITASSPVEISGKQDIWEVRAIALEDTLTGMPGFQDKLSSLEDWLTNVERELFPTRDLVKRTVERFPARFGITKDNVVYVKFAQFPATKDKSNRLIFRPGVLPQTKPEGEVKILITPEMSGYDVSAIDSSGRKVKTAWGYDRNNALMKAREMANFYRDYHNQPATIEWV